MSSQPMQTPVDPGVQGLSANAVEPLVRRRQWSRYVSLGVAFLVVALAIVSAAAPQVLAPYHPSAMDSTAILKPPSVHHLFGTDQFGRDVFSRVIYGSRGSLEVGVASVIVGGIVGGLLGLISGFAGKWVDMVIMRMIDVLMAFPGILLALTIVSVLGPSTVNVIIAISISAVPGYARIMRGQVLAIRSRPYVDAARAVGTKSYDILFRHILPNSITPLLVMATVGVGVAILVAAGLSFLGLGAQSTVPGWGRMLSDGQDYLTVAWWVATFPGIVITILVVAVNLIGDELRNRLDPKSANR